jgi:hypothetical protein
MPSARCSKAARTSARTGRQAPSRFKYRLDTRGLPTWPASDRIRFSVIAGRAIVSGSRTDRKVIYVVGPGLGAASG